jgi:DNA-binding NtrC family response regulator
MYVRPREIHRRETHRPGILVIDDNAAVRSGIENALAFHGLDIFHASGPCEIRTALQAKPIDLVLADLVMNEHSREALVMALHGAAERNPRAVPVIAMSERDMWEDLKMFSAADAIGATAVLRKPLSAGSLLQLLNSVLQSAADRHASKRPYAPDDGSGDRHARTPRRLH